MKAPKVPVLIDGTDEYLLIIDDGEEWSAVAEAFNRHYPDRARLPFDPANYTQAEIDAVMIEFEAPKTPTAATVSPANSD